MLFCFNHSAKVFLRDALVRKSFPAYTLETLHSFWFVNMTTFSVCVCQDVRNLFLLKVEKIAPYDHIWDIFSFTDLLIYSPSCLQFLLTLWSNCRGLIVVLFDSMIPSSGLWSVTTLNGCRDESVLRHNPQPAFRDQFVSSSALRQWARSLRSRSVCHLEWGLLLGLSDSHPQEWLSLSSDWNMPWQGWRSGLSSVSRTRLVVPWTRSNSHPFWGGLVAALSSWRMSEWISTGIASSRGKTSTRQHSQALVRQRRSWSSVDLQIRLPLQRRVRRRWADVCKIHTFWFSLAPTSFKRSQVFVVLFFGRAVHNDVVGEIWRWRSGRSQKRHWPQTIVFCIVWFQHVLRTWLLPLTLLQDRVDGMPVSCQACWSISRRSGLQSSRQALAWGDSLSLSPYLPLACLRRFWLHLLSSSEHKQWDSPMAWDPRQARWCLAPQAFSTRPQLASWGGTGRGGVAG